MNLWNSRTPGAFVGCALNGNMVMTRTSENSRFYGAPVKASDILLGSMPRPPAAAILYHALSDLFLKVESYSDVGLDQSIHALAS